LERIFLTQLASNNRSSSHLAQRMLLDCLGKTEQAKYYIFVQGSMIT